MLRTAVAGPSLAPASARATQSLWENETAMPNTSTRRILLSDVKATPWKNGGGITREIATGGVGTGQDWGWRVSIADVERDGPFSIFPNTDRVIAVIDGAGMDLRDSEGIVTALEPFHTVGISGDDPLFGRLRRGPVRDLNVMTLRDRFAATLDIWHGPRAATLEVGKNDCVLVHSLNGSCAVRVGGETHQLAPAETLLRQGQDSLEIQLAADVRCAVIRIAPRMTN